MAINHPNSHRPLGKTILSTHLISVITVTLNASACIRELADSLAMQTTNDFIWIVKDCNSSDETLEIVESYSDRINILAIQQDDLGIYDGLNQALGYCSTPYYMVAGSDDIIAPEAIRLITGFIANGSEEAHIYLNDVQMNGRLYRPGKGNGFLYGMQGFAASHAIGCVIKKELHSSIGNYDTNLRIAADAAFLYEARRNGFMFQPTRILAGRFTIGGVSTCKHLFTAHSEFALVQIRYFPSYKFAQTILFVLRLLKNWHRY